MKARSIGNYAPQIYSSITNPDTRVASYIMKMETKELRIIVSTSTYARY